MSYRQWRERGALFVCCVVVRAFARGNGGYSCSRASSLSTPSDVVCCRVFHVSFENCCMRHCNRCCRFPWHVVLQPLSAS